MYRSTVAGVYSAPIATLTASSRNYLDSDLAPGIYYYRVSAVNSVEGPKSNEITVNVTGVPTGAPGTITLISLSAHKDKVDIS